MAEIRRTVAKTKAGESSQEFKLMKIDIEENKAVLAETQSLHTTFGEHLSETQKKETPRLLRQSPDAFYEGGPAQDFSYPSVRGSGGKYAPKGILVSMNDFFEPFPGQSSKRGMRVMLTGPAGSGKTTILSRFARDATNKNIDYMDGRDYLVHQVNCRELTPDEEITVAEFLFKTMVCKNTPTRKSMEVALRWMVENPEKTTFIIDALDTMRFELENVKLVIGPYDSATPGVILRNILTGTLFRESFVLSASREHKILNYTGNLCADKIISLAGLTSESIRNLTIGFLGEEEGDRVLKKLEEYPGLKELCEAPVFLVFAIIGLKKTDDLDAFIPKTMAGVLVNLINSLSRSKHTCTLDLFTDEEFIQAMNKMKDLAYNGMMEDRVIYTQEDLDKVKLTHEEITGVAIIVPGKVDKSQKILETGDVSFFAHQTIGELLFSLKILELNLEDFCTFISHNIHVPKYLVIRQLICGSLLSSQVCDQAQQFLLQGSDFEEKRKILVESLKQEFSKLVKDATKQRNLLELLHVIHESEDGGKGIIPSNIDEISVTQIQLMPSDAFVIGRSISHSSYLRCLDLANCNLSSESLQALKCEHTELKISHLNVSGNNDMGVKGLATIGHLVKTHGVDKLEMRRCGLEVEEVDALDEGIGNAKVTELDISGNHILVEEGWFSVGRLVRSHGVENLEMEDCDLNSKEVDSLDEGLGDAKVAGLNISYNDKLGVEGLSSVGRLVSRHGVDKLVMTACGMQFKEVDSLDEGLEDTKFNELVVSFNVNLGAKGFFSVGRLLRNHGVDNFEMWGCDIDSDVVNSLDEGLGDAKVTEFNISGNQYLGVEGFSAVGRLVQKHGIDKLKMVECRLKPEEVDSFDNGLGDAKLTELNVMQSPNFGANGFLSLGRVVRRHGVDRLKVAGGKCELESEHVDALNEGLGDRKVKEIDLRRQYSFLPTSAICKLLPKVTETLDLQHITVGEEDENLLQQELNKIHPKSLKIMIGGYYGLEEKILQGVEDISLGRSVSATNLSELEEINLLTKDAMSQPVLKALFIGPDGGAISLMGCQLEFPSQSFKAKTPVCISVRVRYEDSPEGYKAISPEFECSTLGIPFTGLATISLPLHIMVEAGRVRIMCKKKNQHEWKELEINPSISNRVVKFQVPHFCWYKAVCANFWSALWSWWKICIHNYIFFKSATSQIFCITCIASQPVEENCFKILEEKGYKKEFLPPDDITLGYKEEMRYRVECFKPAASAVVPAEEVVLASNYFNKQSEYRKAVILEPPPTHDTAQVYVKYTVSQPGMADNGNIIALEWNTNERVQNCQEPDATAAVEKIQIMSSTEDFYESHLTNKEEIYCIDRRRKKGRVLIINNEFLRTQRERRGSQVDVTNLIALWKGLGFEVMSKNNLSAAEIRSSCTDFAKETVNVSVLVVIIMSHGGKQDGKEHICAIDGRVLLEEVISNFTSNNSPHLQGIPKIFLFQACRGGEVDCDWENGIQEDADVVRFPQRSDMLITYPSQAGYKSYRDTINGSLLVNAVTNVFMRHAHNTHILDMLTMVNRHVSNIVMPGGVLQMSNQESYLTKQLFLFPGWPER